MERPEIGLLVTDVDNTLFDWVSSWAACAPHLVQAVSQYLGVEASEAEQRIRDVHRAWGLTECPSCVAELIPDDGVCETIVRDHEARFAATQPVFAGAPLALRHIRQRGARVAAYTESHRAHTWRRLELLGLADSIDVLYSDQRKPDPATLARVARDNRIDLDRVLYVGDNLWKDIAMAQRAGVHAAWARYGTRRDPEDARWLDRLCHWSPADVRAERTAAAAIEPAVILEHGLSELLDRFTFVPHDGFRTPHDDPAADSTRTE